MSTRKELTCSHFPVTTRALFLAVCAFVGMRWPGASSSGQMNILVTGASGFVGSRLIPALFTGGHRVSALARDPSRGDFDPRTVEVFAGDVLTGEGLVQALADVEVAYYLIHSMERPPARERPRTAQVNMGSFSERERRGAENFAEAAMSAGVTRIVYLGGPTASWLTHPGRGTGEHATGGERSPHASDRPSPHPDDGLSPHLRSRAEVERVLREAVPGTVALHASIVIGAGSRSFRFMVRLIERMAVLPLPAWREHRTRPIDARDAIAMLVAAASTPEGAGRSLDIGGAQILNYGEMIERIAELMLVARPTVRLEVNATALTGRVAAAVAREDPELVIALMESLQGDLLPDGPNGNAHLHAAESLGVELHGFDAAVEYALREWELIEPLAAR